MTRRSRTRSVAGPAQLPGPPPLVEGVEWGSSAVPRKTEWYWPGALPAGSLCLLEGRKSTGKSTVAAAIAACVTCGPVIPGWTGPRDGRVLWQAGEEAWDSVVIPRLIAAGADLQRVGRLQLRDSRGQLRRCVLPDDIVYLQDAIREGGVRVLVLDPYISLAHPSLDMRVEQQARVYLEGLAQTLAECDCLGLLIRHLRKGCGGDAREAGLGSVAISNVARSLLRTDEHPHQPGDHVLSVIACNYGRRMATQVYRLRDSSGSYPRVDWIGCCDLDSDTIAEGRGSEADRGEWSDADRILVALIGDGRCPVADLRKEALIAGVSERMLRRAGERLRVVKYRISHANTGWWEWGTPRAGWPPGLSVNHENGQGAQEALPAHAPPSEGLDAMSSAPGGAHADTGLLGLLQKSKRKPKKGADQDA
jgi:hypothetical protein